MNKHQKDIIGKELESLIKVHESVYKQLMIQEAVDLYSAFAECQGKAIQVGQRIELLEGEGTFAVKLLEEYCEKLYHYSVATDIEVNEMISALNSILQQVLNQIDKEFETKREIVFLPYKASMWDSLESIWKAADKDPQCNCRVICIPYYDKNPDGSFGSMHYEAEEFPEEVPILHYDEYLLEENRPDVIFFHNPYDKYNYVTSVMPSFYSSELKKHTDLLVYVPYFVTDDRLPDHLSETMGVFNADKVIAQSDTIKELYKAAYIELLGSEQRKKENAGGIVNQEFWKLLNKKAEDKFIAIGSPKIDKVIEYMINPPGMPKEWEDIIRSRVGRSEKEDISDVKLILYNTSVNDLLNYREQAIKKLKAVLRTFKERNDVVLLWRPHPLNVATMRSIVPTILGEYLRIIEEYRKEAYGIYDDSADVHRAIALADAYYGDAHSSIIQMFGVTGKPLMFQSMELTDNLEEGKRYSIGFEDFIDDGEYLWFSDCNRNGLYRFNKNTNETEFMGRFPEEPEDGKRLYISGVKHDNKLYFAPFAANNGAVYDVLSREFHLFKTTDDREREMLGPQKYFGSINYKDKIFMLPCLFPAIGIYSVVDNNVQYDNGWLKELTTLCNITNDAFGRRFIVIEDRYILMPFCNANAVLEYDMLTSQHKIHVVGKEDYSYSGICYDGRNYWLSPRHDGAVVRWDKENQEVTIYNDFPENYEKGSYSYADAVYCDGFVWMFPLTGNMVLKINPSSGEMKGISSFNPYLEPLQGRMKKFHWIKTDGSKIYLGAVLNNVLLSYDPACDEMIETHITYPQEIQNELIMDKVLNKHKSNNYYFYRESEYFPFEDYLKFDCFDTKIRRMKRKEAFYKLFSNCDGQSGDMIYKITLGIMSITD